MLGSKNHFKELSDNEDLFESIHLADGTVKINKKKIQILLQLGLS